MDSSSTAPVSIVLLSALDRVARESAAVGLLLDLPHVAVVTHDLVAGTVDEVRRVITDRTGRLVDDTMPLEHACLSCTVRENIVPTLQMVLARGGWRTLVLALRWLPLRVPWRTPPTRPSRRGPCRTPAWTASSVSSRRTPS